MANLLGDPPCRLVVETVPRHPQFDKGDPTYQRLRKVSYPALY